MPLELTPVSEMTFLESVPENAMIYVVIPGDDTPYFTTKENLINAKVPINLRVIGGELLEVPGNFIITRITSLNDINSEFTGEIDEDNMLSIVDAVEGDIYLVDGYRS